MRLPNGYGPIYKLSGNRVYTSETGKDQPHNNMQPYVAVHIFRRSA